MIAQAFNFTQRVNQERPFVSTIENLSTQMLIIVMGTWQRHPPENRLQTSFLRDPLYGTHYFCIHDNDQMKETVFSFF